MALLESGEGLEGDQEIVAALRLSNPGIYIREEQTSTI